MKNILTLIEEKINPKFLIYLRKNHFELYKNLNKDLSSISYNLINNKIFEVFEINTLNNEELYLIGADNDELGWVSVTNPILILNSFSENVSLVETIKENPLNEVLEIHSILKTNQLYTAKYICNFNNELYVGLENEKDFLGFYPIEAVNFGKIKETSFKFNNNKSNVYISDDLTNEQTIFTDEHVYMTDQYYVNLGIGIVKIGKKKYWFKGKETSLNHSDIISIEKNYDEYYLEHLLQSIQIEKNLREQGKKVNSAINKEYIKSLTERTAKLKEKNLEHLETNKKLNQEVKEGKLELKRKNSKLDYFERLTSNQKKKIAYFEERNQKLENRMELLEKKLNDVNDKYKQLKNSKAVKIQSRFFRK